MQAQVLYGPGGQPYIVETRSIPLIEGTVFGWAVFDVSGNAEVWWGESLELPGPTENWPDTTKLSTISISPYKNMAITQGIAPGGGYVMHTWSVSEDDPDGPAHLKVLVGSNPVEVSRVIDGDTFVTDTRTTVRLVGVDTPEMGHLKGVPSEPGAFEATEWLRMQLRARDAFFMTTCKDRLDRFGRTLGCIWLLQDRQWVLLNDELIKQGHTRPSFGGTACCHEAT